jgi:hypothetical protein
MAVEQFVVDWVDRNKRNGDNDFIGARFDEIGRNWVVGAYAATG